MFCKYLINSVYMIGQGNEKYVRNFAYYKYSDNYL